MDDRVKPLEGVRNFRDFGGYRTSEGARIKPGMLFRSGHYNEATDEDIAFLKTLDVSFQVDLRRPDERDRQPNRWPMDPVKVVTNDGGREDKPAHIAFLEQDDVTPDSVEGYMTHYYAQAPFKPHMIDLFRDWFDHLVDAEKGGVVNCAAGKDRTGIICALTHLALGVDEDTVIEDYLLTNTAVDIETRLPMATEFFNEQLGKTYDPDVYRPFMGVREVYLRKAFEVMSDAHGTPLGYAREVLGVDDQTIARMKSRLLAG